jgi:hypothetical protein
LNQKFKNMTLKELLDRCEFKDIAPHITQWSSGRSLAPFKQAFDILRHLEPDTSSEGELEIVRGYNEFSQTYYPLIKQWFETDTWECELASKIIVSDELTLTDAEIAAHCLWELTYLGFDQSSFESWREAQMSIVGGLDKKETDAIKPYTVAVEKLEYMLEINYLPKKFKDADSYVEKLVNECLDAKPRTFGKLPKSMRHMIKKHIKALERKAKVEERKAKVEDSIRRLIANSKSFSREELEYLFNTKLICERPFHSRTYDVCKRVDYLIDLFTNYVSEDFSQYTRFLMMFRASSENPLVQSELEIIQNFFNQYLPPSANIRYGYGNDETLGTEVSLLLLCSY